ncbi:MAG: TonB-dependent receptor, partial [Bacteroidales bacterium]|nr:TonB-dependent receptor [Bacteroidales bacterium]
MKIKVARMCLLIIFSMLLPAVEVYGKVVVSGYVRDAATGEELIGANVAILETGSGTVTNTYGYYSLSLDPGFYTLVYSYVGYVSEKHSLRLGEDLELNVELAESMQELEEVTVTAEAGNANITRIETGSAPLPIQSIRKMPALLGEVDVIKAIQLLPGVQVTSEGSSGFSVRGGSPDMNMIQLDEAAVYNASHVMGFFSVFNNDAIKDVKLYKGDIPARYGGRLSSVLDVRMKDGNSKKFSGTGGIGIIASRLTLEGPIIKDRTAFIVSGRRTYADIFLFLSSEKNMHNNKLYFYDFNAKVNHVINENNRIYLSGYFGRDVFSNKFAGMKLGNQTATLRWNHLFSKELFSNFSFIYSKYKYGLGTASDNEANSFEWDSDLEDYGLKGDLIYY